jgi:3-oxoacyl-[acyl-carrier protein] reductase
MRLAGQIALVAGGSRGIGREVVLGLARAGAHVVFTYVSDQAASDRLIEDCRDAGGRADAVRADIADPQAMRAAFEAVSSLAGNPPDIYIAAAFPKSIFLPTALLSLADYDRMFDAVRGHYFALQCAAGVVRDDGRIIVFSSGAAQMPQAASGAYAGAKSALEKFALSLAREVGGRGVRVNVLSPGVTRTEGLVAPQAMVDLLVGQTPLGRLGESADVAAVAVALCLPELSWVNGQVIQANGGIL